MSQHTFEPIAIVGVGAIMPDAPDATAFWHNITSGRYSITNVPPERWDPELYYDPDHRAVDKTYSKIGGWVREFGWDPIAWRLPVPPKVAEQLDDGQKWAVSAAREALVDAGWPGWDVDPERVAVILGNALGGEKHYASNQRVELAESLQALRAAPSFAALPNGVRDSIVTETRKGFLANYLEINEDTMPGELANVIAGRVSNLFNFRGPNFTTDAACASALAAIWSAASGLASHQYDAAVTGGVDRNMAVASFVKFCKIGALSATGTRPFDAGADGFVMGEGAALFVLKRLADAEAAGDRIYAVLLGVAGSSDGKGKGITAPNPVGQRLAVEGAWRMAGMDPASASAVEAHGTSTRAGDAAELESLTGVFKAAPVGGIALGSVKSNIGHLKAAAGAAGLFKMVRSLHEKVLPPSLHFANPNTAVDWPRSPFQVVTELREWPAPRDGARCAGVSAFGFGGTNFHVVLEEYVPGRHRDGARASFAGADVPKEVQAAAAAPAPVAGERDARRNAASTPATAGPLRGALVVGGESETEIAEQLRRVQAEAAAGRAPAPAVPDPALAGAAVRLAIDYADAAELAAKAGKALTALSSGNAALWRMLRAQGVFLGRGPAPKVAFLYTGQGSQYVDMLRELREREPVVAETFAEADRIMTPMLGRPLSSFIFADGVDRATLEHQLTQTEITQPAILTVDLALTRMLAERGVDPDMVMGHSLGEYGALVAAGALDFPAALEAVSARGRGMANLTMPDNGAMAAVFAPLPEIERIVAEAGGAAVIANVNSTNQAVVGGATVAVEKIVQHFVEMGITAQRIPVSHAFHTSIVAPASEPLMAALRRLDVHAPRLPIVANVTGQFYPAAADVDTMVDILGKQVASPVQFVTGLHTLYDAGARVFVEVGPKKALHGFVEDVLGEDVTALFTNHPKMGDVASFNQALCGLYAAGLGLGARAAAPSPAPTEPRVDMDTARQLELGKLFAEFLERGRQVYGGPAGGPAATEPVAITGAALGLPGVEHVFDDDNVGRILDGQQFIESIPQRFRRALVDLHITRLVKRESGDPTFETIDDEAHVVKLAGRHAPLDMVATFGVEPSRDAAFDDVTRLAVGSGFDALRDAGIPLVMHYRTTTLGTQLPDRWGLPEQMRDDTGVVFASAMPGLDTLAHDIELFHTDRGRREQLAALEAVRSRMRGNEPAVAETDRRIAQLRHLIDTEPFAFDRRFLFRLLAMGHSQFAEIIGARGPNTQVNSACASTTLALGVAEDWIRTGRCRRVIVISADDVTNDAMLPWIAAGFLASGAAATDDAVEDAAVPFDRRRHGMIVGAGAAAFVVEAADAARERGIRPICEVLGSVVANSAYHGTRLDVSHICQVMEQLVRQAEARGVDRNAIARSTMFVSHETYTPARGGSAQAEIDALRSVFGQHADEIVIANTKGMTGHAMGAGIEDVVAIKALETGIVPPVPNFREPDPDLGNLNLSKGGAYPVEYALRLAAGFGSQIAMSLLRWTPMPDRQRRSPDQLGFRYRIVDEEAWRRWLAAAGGHPDPVLEVVTRRLRIVDGGPSAVATEVPQARASVARSVVAPTAPEPVVPEPVVLTPVVPVPVAPAMPVPAEPVVAQVAEPVAVEDEVVAAVVSIVAELTGYPAELLDLDLDLEADLGVDTVKQAEVFAAVRGRFGVEREETLQLRDFPTLAHVIGWVRDRTGLVAPEQAQPQPVAPAAAPATASVEVSAPVVSPAVDEVVDAVVSIVAELTGYPAELLDLDLDLEADLGVDTVKQAEVFAAVRGRFGVEREETLQLRDFPTLAHVIGWVRDRTGLVAPEQAQPQPVAPAAAPATASVEVSAPVVSPAVDEVVDAVVSIVAELTGYPAELLDLDLDLEADLGVDTVKQAEVFAAVRGRFGVEREETLQLRDFPTLAHVIGWVRDRTGLVAPEQAQPQPVAPAAAPATASVEVSAPVVSPAVDEVVDAVVSIVAELTGYPAELLDLDLDLEADLGVDTVKQAEVFAAVRGRFGVEREETLQLRDFPTLAHVIGWVRDRTAPTAQPPVATPDEQASEPDSAIPAEDAGHYPRRVPVPVLRPALDQCTPTGVALADARVVVMLDEGGVGRALVSRLEKAGATALTLDPGVDTGEILTRLDGWLADGPVAGVYWLAALDDEGPVAAMDLTGWREALRRRVKNLYATMRRLVERPPFLVAATRFGGYHGYDDAGATAPLGGAVRGFAKAYHREQPDALVKVVDFPAGRRTAAPADVLVAETLRDRGCVEAGHVDGLRFAVGLVERPFGDGTGGTPLGPDSTVVVTGAAGSIVSAITADLAAAAGGATFHLLDLTAEPDPNDPDLRRFATDLDGLKTDLADRLKAAGERPTPVRIGKELAGLERRAAALAAIEAVRAAGGTARYHSVDLTDADAIALVIDEVRSTSGKIDLLVHAAGIEISRALADKEPREYDLVFGVKADGWFTLLHAAGDLPIGATVAFASVAGRFGNAGQTDYAAANDLLAMLASNVRRSRPDTRAIVLDWTAWGGIGMATRGSIPTVMAAAGIEMLDPRVGVPWIRRELTCSAERGEVLVAGSTGMLTAEPDPTGGLDPAAIATEAAGPMIGTAVSAGVYSGLVVQTTLDPTQQPFLDDHRIDGTAVLPGVMGIEGFAELARLLAPGLYVTAVEDVRFLAPLKFYRDEPRTLTLRAVVRRDGADLVADCALEAERILASSPEPQRTTHFTGSVRLATAPPTPEREDAIAQEGPTVEAADVYRLYFHGPAYQVVDTAWSYDGGDAARLAEPLPPNHLPADLPTVTGPRLVELCFQTAGLVDGARHSRFALPAGVDRVMVLRDPASVAGPLYAVAVEHDDHYDCSVRDASGEVVVRVLGYRSTALPGPLTDELRRPLAAALGG